MSLSYRFASRKAEERADVEARAKDCGHWELAPRWDRAEDIGTQDRITSYAWTACGASLSREEAKAIQPL